MKGYYWLFMLIVLSSSVLGANEWFDDTDAQGYGVYNLSWINSTNFCIGSPLSCIGAWSDAGIHYSHLSNFTDDLGARGYTLLSNFTDDLGNRGYIYLSNFTDDLGNRGYVVLSNFTDDLGARGYTHLSNFTDNLGNRGYIALSNFTNDITINRSKVVNNWAACPDGSVQYLDNETGRYCQALSVSNYLTLSSYAFGINETRLNATIDARDSDTTYSESNKYLTLTGTVFGVDESALNTTITAITDARDSDTTYTAGTGLVLSSTTFTANMSYLNATMDARDDVGSGAPYDQDLNTTNAVEFAMLNISGDSLYIGNSDAIHSIYFYEDSNATGERLYWDNTNDNFRFSDKLYIDDDLQVNSNIYTNGDLYTSGVGDDFWLGTGTQTLSKFQANASGSVKAVNITATSYFFGYLNASYIMNAPWGTSNSIFDQDLNTTSDVSFNSIAGEINRSYVINNWAFCPAGSAQYGENETGRYCDSTFLNTSEALALYDQDLNTTSNVKFAMLNVTGDNVYLGSSESNGSLWFYEDGSHSERLYWDTTSNDKFVLTDYIEVQGSMYAGYVFGYEDIYTTGSGDDLWLGSSTQSTANIQINATGNIKAKNISLDRLTIRDDNIYVGDSETNHSIYFYENGGATGARLWWDDTPGDRFRFDDDVYTTGLFYGTGGISSGSTVVASSDIYTDGAGDDFWLGTSTQTSSNVMLNATGSIKVSNITVGYVKASEDIYTTGAGDSLWLGTATQTSALFQANATGNVKAVNVTVTCIKFTSGGMICTG